MKFHIERTGDAIRKKDKGRRVTMCGWDIGTTMSGIDERDIRKPGQQTQFLCDHCRWIAEHYEKRKTFVRDTEVMCEKQKQQGIKPQLLGGPACEDSEL